MTLFIIDQKKCRKDGLCAAVCPREIITVRIKERFPEPTENAAELCISCGHCAAVCPHDALQLTAVDTAMRQISDSSCLPSHDQLVQLIRGRRSIRAYKEEAVDRDVIEQVIGLARYAPTARNSQLLQWLVIDSPDKLTTLKNHTIDWMRNSVEKKDPGAIAYGFENVLRAWDEGSDPILRGAPGLIVLHAPAQYPFGVIDSTIAMTTFELAATTRKLGTCWAGFFMIAAKAWRPLRDFLDLPVARTLTTAVMVGFPKYRYAALPERNDPVINWR
jgi:nitroreductase/Pyruvate/2-oxoacid:ferredoxin oxidoreductase delta subunit